MTDDPTPRVPPLGPHGAPGARRFTRASWELSPHTRRSLLILVALMVVVLAGSMITVPYVVYRPGATFNALGDAPGRRVPMISFSGAPTYPTEGSLDVTTVALYGGPGFELNVWDAVRFRLEGAQFVERDRVYPPEVTRDQVTEVNRAEMSGSQREAVAVALRATGRRVVEQAVVGYVHPDGPAAGRLREGDVVASVNGTPVDMVTDVSRLVQATPQGAATRLGVVRDGSPVTVSVTPVPAQSRRLLRVELGSRFAFPVQVTINAGDVGGPSAGLIFALAVYDMLTPGPLTAGQQVAGTGTIASDGTVGPIGGVEHKLVGAQDSGARWFLAPAANCGTVNDNPVDGLRVVKVTAFRDALTAVEQIAAGRGDALPTC